MAHVMGEGGREGGGEGGRGGGEEKEKGRASEDCDSAHTKQINKKLER